MYRNWSLILLNILQREVNHIVLWRCQNILIQQLLDEAEFDMRNYWITPSSNPQSAFNPVQFIVQNLNSF